MTVALYRQVFALPLFVCSCVCVHKHSQELSNVAPVHTHCGHFGAAVLMKFVAAGLTSEAV